MPDNSTEEDFPLNTLQRDDRKLVPVLWLDLPPLGCLPPSLSSCPSTRSPLGSSRAWEATFGSSKIPYMVLHCAVPCIHLWRFSEGFFGSTSTLELVGCPLRFCPSSCLVNPNRKAASLLAHSYLPSPVPHWYWREEPGAWMSTKMALAKQ